LLLAAACAMAAVPEGMEPPVISMRLTDNGQLAKGNTDANGVPCVSHGANQDSCKALEATPHQTHYAFCYVGSADEKNCPKPEVEAHDHHDGKIAVTEQIHLFVSNNPGEGPKAIDKDVTCGHAGVSADECGLDYSQRGEYTLIYDAMDSSGNKADTVIFRIFIRDVEAPTIVAGKTESLYKSQGHYGSYFNLPALKATDKYDGDVSDTLTYTMHSPSKACLDHSTQLDCETGSSCVWHSNTCYGGTQKYTYDQEILIDTSVYGKYHLQVTAHDHAAAFGKDFKDNYITRQGYVIVRSNSITTHYAGTESQFTPVSSAPTPAPKHMDIESHHHHLSIPPILILKDGDGSVITRSSPFGEHHSEALYRKHLDHMGYTDTEIADHINSIVEREEKMAKMLGEDHQWLWNEKKGSISSPYEGRRLLRGA